MLTQGMSCWLPVAAVQVREALPREGRSYDLVWLLDAALIQRRLTLQHMRKLAELFEGYIKVGSRGKAQGREEREAARVSCSLREGMLPSVVADSDVACWLVATSADRRGAVPFSVGVPILPWQSAAGWKKSCCTQ